MKAKEKYALIKRIPPTHFLGVDIGSSDNLRFCIVMASFFEWAFIPPHLSLH
jgi:hypothetical protein